MGQEEKELGKEVSTEVQSPPDPIDICGGCIATPQVVGPEEWGLSFYTSAIFSHWPWAASRLA